MTRDSSDTHISRTALLSGACSLIAMAGLQFPWLLAFGILGGASGIAAMRSDRPGRLLTALVLCGVIVSTSEVIGGSIWHVTRYRNEAPPGVLRVDFSQTFVDADGPAAVGDLIGHMICIKGYCYPPANLHVTHFVMTADGGRPQHMGQVVGVALRSGESWQYDQVPIAVSGTLTLNPGFADNPWEPEYLLIDATVRKSRTPFQLEWRTYTSTC